MSNKRYIFGEISRNIFRRSAEFVMRVLIVLPMLFSSVLPSAAELQHPSGSTVNSPYNYITSGTINNPSNSATAVSSAQLTENSYTTNTGMCGQNVNNATFSIAYTPTLQDDLYTYTLTKTSTDLRTGVSSSEVYDLGAKMGGSSANVYKLLNVYPSEGGNIGNRLMTELRSDGGQ